MSKRGGSLGRLLTVPGAVAAFAFVLAALAGAGYVPPKTANAEPASDTPKLMASAAWSDGMTDSSTSPSKTAALSKTSQGRITPRPAFKTRTPVKRVVVRKARPKRVVTVRRAVRPLHRTTVARKRTAVSGSGWRTATASWYGPGFYGHTMAGGGKLTASSMIVAHRSLPFGTRIQIDYNGRTVIAVVMDRGPFIGGRTFDLGPGTASALGFGGVHTIKYRIL